MSDVRHYFSKLKTILFVLIAGLFLSACANSGHNAIANIAASRTMSAAKSDKLSKQQIVQPVAAPTAAPVGSSGRTVKRILKTQKNAIAHQGVLSRPQQSHWCTYLNENAAAEATILQAPTISGHINDEGRKTATLGYDVMNIARAKLIRDTAEAKCQRYLATAAITSIGVVAPNKFTQAGFAAKAKLIHQRKRKLRAVKLLIKRELANGNLNRPQAATLKIAADRVIADGAKAASEAAMRDGLDTYDVKNISKLAAKLFKAESDLASINSDIRSADAVSVNLQGGWREGFTENGIRIQKNSMFGGVNVSVKLGAFNPARMKHEEAAHRARLRAHKYEPGSIFWKIAQVIHAHQNGRRGLVQSRQTLNAGRSHAVQLKINLPKNDPVFLAQRYRMEIEIVKFDAELAAVNASIRQLDENLRKLSLLVR